MFFQWIDSPSGTKSPRYWSFESVISSKHRPLPDNTQNSYKRDIHTPGGIRNCNPNKRAAADVSLRPRGHRDRRSGFSG